MNSAVPNKPENAALKAIALSWEYYSYQEDGKDNRGVALPTIKLNHQYQYRNSKMGNKPMLTKFELLANRFTFLVLILSLELLSLPL